MALELDLKVRKPVILILTHWTDTKTIPQSVCKASHETVNRPDWFCLNSLPRIIIVWCLACISVLVFMFMYVQINTCEWINKSLLWIIDTVLRRFFLTDWKELPTMLTEQQSSYLWGNDLPYREKKLLVLILTRHDLEDVIIPWTTMNHFCWCYSSSVQKPKQTTQFKFHSKVYRISNLKHSPCVKQFTKSQIVGLYVGTHVERPCFMFRRRCPWLACTGALCLCWHAWRTP